jgi:hypothetical protein
MYACTGSGTNALLGMQSIEHLELLQCASCSIHFVHAGKSKLLHESHSFMCPWAQPNVPVLP